MSDLPGLPDGAFTRCDAVAAGVTDGRLARAGRRGALHHLGRGVWADGTLLLDERLRLAAVHVRAPGCVGSHATAGRAWGAPVDDPRLHATAPAAAAVRSGPGLVIHRDALSPADVTVRRGQLVTGPYRTALDLARWLPPVAAVVALDALLMAERVEREELLDRTARLVDVRGAARARAAVERSRYGAQSPGETRLRLLLMAGAVPEPVLQHRIDLAEAVVVADLCWPDARLVVEYDGFGPHTERATFERDRRRWSWLRGAGWELRAYTAESVRDRQEAIAAEVVHLLRTHR